MNEYKEMIGGLMDVFKSADGDAKQIAADVKEKSVELPTEQQLPEIISSQYDSIVELEDSVVKSIQLAKDAEDSAKTAADFTVHWYGGRKEAIELLQNASEYSSKALISLAEAQKRSFEYQTKLTEITKFLFGLGVSSIAMNRCVVRELELKLKGASDEDISDLAKQELKNVILQLKAQEDMLQKQEILTGKVKEQSGQIKEIDKQLENIEEVDEEQYEKIAENTEKITKHSKVLSAQQQKDEEHDKFISVGMEKDKEHDEKISENARDIDELELQDEKHDRMINDLDIIIKEHGRILEKHSKQDAELERKIQDVTQNTDDMIEGLKANISENADIVNENIALIESKINVLDTMVSKRIWKIIVSVVAGASLLLNILQLLGII